MKLDLLFNMLKDTVETNTKEKRAKLKRRFPDVDISELHRRIVNYQVEKYGSSLNENGFKKNHAECVKIARNRKDRRKQRLYGKIKRKI